jgi:hypothetical protein
VTVLIDALDRWQRDGKIVNIAVCNRALWVLVYTEDGEPVRFEPKNA